MHHNKIMGWSGDRLLVSVRAAPTDGQANDALIDTLADDLHLPKSSIRITYGEKSTLKTLEIWSTNNVFLRKRIEQYTHHAFPESKAAANDGEEDVEEAA